ncbi:MAG: transglycosylase SLT domain-containing protein [Spirochaetales bacterium]|nr:transglycosylase SLT domain-containing protein [Spirochaetales bacterium]
MDRDLFRRKIIAGVFFFAAGAVLHAQEYPDWLSKKNITHDITSSVLPAKQGHIGPQVFEIPVPYNNAVHAERSIFEYTHNKTELDKTIKRSLVFRTYIMKIIGERKLPAELFFVAFVESNFNPNAISWAGAAGLWQIMDFNAKNTGLAMDEWQDQRHDFWKSTVAAFRLLESNYEYYKNWYLAIAAYNCGRGALDKAIKKAGTRDFFQLVAKNALPKETAHYVPRILAVASLASYPGRNGYYYSWDEVPEWTQISLLSPIDIGIFAQKAGIPEDIIQKGNAELSYRVTPPVKNHLLKIPLQYKAGAEAVLGNTDQKLVNHSVYTLRSGDTLYGLSRHYDMPIDVLLFYNPHVSYTKFPVGTTIVIPFIKDGVAPPNPRRAFSDKVFTKSCTVMKGDSLFSIAAKHDITVEELAYKNKLKLTSVIKPGDALNVPAQ